MDKSCLRKAFILWVLFLIIKGLLFIELFSGNKLLNTDLISLSVYNVKEILLAISPLTLFLKSKSMTFSAVTYAFDILTCVLILVLTCLDTGRRQKIFFALSLILNLTYAVYVALIPLYLLTSLIPYIGVSNRTLPAALPAAALFFLAKSYKKPDF